MPANNRPLLLILILRNIFEMDSTVNLVTECPGEVEQHGFNEKSVAMTPIAMVVSAASMHYVIKILLDLFKGYDQVQRYQVMALVDEGHSVATAGIVATILHASSVTTICEESNLTRIVNIGLTQGVPASPKLYNKTSNVLIRRALHALQIVDDSICPTPLR